MQKVSFTVDGQKLVGHLFVPKKVKEKNPAILFIHGWQSSEESALGRAETLVKLGFICMTFSMRGHGESEGDVHTLTRQDFLNDALAVYDFLIRQKGVDKESISVVGSSFGSYIAALVSRERKVRNFVFRVPANFANDSWDRPQFEFSADNDPEELYAKFTALGKKETYALDALRKFSGNVLIVEAELDSLIPRQMVKNYIHAVQDKTKIKHTVMMGADHSLRDEKLRAEYGKILTDWFRTKV